MNVKHMSAFMLNQERIELSIRLAAAAYAKRNKEHYCRFGFAYDQARYRQVSAELASR